MRIPELVEQLPGIGVLADPAGLSGPQVGVFRDLIEDDHHWAVSGKPAGQVPIACGKPFGPAGAAVRPEPGLDSAPGPAYVDDPREQGTVVRISDAVHGYRTTTGPYRAELTT